MSYKDEALGNILKRACESARQEIILIAPFIKYDTLSKLLESIKRVNRLTVITRWQLGDIVTGVCDLEIFNLLRSFTRAELRTLRLLHAKYYRFDKQTFIGSANLTNSGLGWKPSSNEEILIPLKGHTFEKLLDLEQRFLQDSILVDESIVKNLSKLANLLKEKSALPLPTENTEIWFPSCKRPEQIFNIMTKEQQSVTEQAINFALKDIATLNIPICKDEISFKRAVNVLISSEKIFSDIQKMIKVGGLTDSEGISFLKKDYENYIQTSAESQWRVLKEWIKYFWSDDFFITPTEEKILPGRVLKDD